MRSIDEIRERLKDGNAVILTASELKYRIARNDDISDIDIITCGTCGVMSGTYAVFSIPVSSPGAFFRADSISVQDVPAIPGPCPNERLGIVDLMVFGTAHADSRYGGGHLFRDLIAGKTVHIEVVSGGRIFENDVCLEDIPFARLFTTRSAFKNYSAIINRGKISERTIFSVLPLEGSCTQATVSGCGEINPLENDPDMKSLSAGKPVIMNGACGRIIGTGTRSSPERPNLSVHAEMIDMVPEYCGGFITSAGPECITSIASAIPLVDNEIIQNLTIRDDEIPIPVVDICNRKPVGTASYGHIWRNTASSIHIVIDRCLTCPTCAARVSCPVDAIREDGTINQHICFVCGTCVQVCKGLVYAGNFGSLSVGDHSIPIVLRQSDRRKAEMLCRKVRDMLHAGEYVI